MPDAGNPQPTQGEKQNAAASAEKTKFQIIGKESSGRLFQQSEVFDDVEEASRAAQRIIEDRPDIHETFVVRVHSAFRKKYSFEKTL